MSVCLFLYVFMNNFIYYFNRAHIDSVDFQKTAAASAVMCITILKSAILVLWLVVTSESVCPPECTCLPFGKTRIRVKCNATEYIPTGIPFNTAEL